MWNKNPWNSGWIALQRSTTTTTSCVASCGGNRVVINERSDLPRCYPSWALWFFHTSSFSINSPSLSHTYLMLTLTRTIYIYIKIYYLLIYTYTYTQDSGSGSRERERGERMSGEGESGIYYGSKVTWGMAEIYIYIYVIDRISLLHRDERAPPGPLSFYISYLWLYFLQHVLEDDCTFLPFYFFYHTINATYITYII